MFKYLPIFSNLLYQEYDGKKLISVTKEGLELEDDEDSQKQLEEQKAAYEELCKLIKEVLGDKIGPGSLLAKNRTGDGSPLGVHVSPKFSGDKIGPGTLLAKSLTGDGSPLGVHVSPKLLGDKDRA